MPDLVIDVPGIQEVSTKLGLLIDAIDRLINKPTPSLPPPETCPPSETNPPFEAIAPPESAFAWLRILTQLDTLILDQTGDIHIKQFENLRNVLLSLEDSSKSRFSPEFSKTLRTQIESVTQRFAHSGTSSEAIHERAQRFKDVHTLRMSLLHHLASPVHAVKGAEKTPQSTLSSVSPASPKPHDPKGA